MQKMNALPREDRQKGRRGLDGLKQPIAGSLPHVSSTVSDVRHSALSITRKIPCRLARKASKS